MGRWPLRAMLREPLWWLRCFWWALREIESEEQRRQVDRYTREMLERERQQS
jgi:hypothetical protein